MDNSRRKKIIFIHHGASIGGAPFSMLEILRRIDRKKFRTLVILPETGPFSDLLKKEDIKYKIIPLFIFYYCPQCETSLSIKDLPILLRDIFRNLLCLPKILKRENPDVVIINASPLLLSGLIAKLMGKKVIWHIRETISTEKPGVLKRIIAAIIRFSAKKTIVMSRFSLKNVGRLGLNNAAIVHGGVDLKKFRPKSVSSEEFKKLGLNENDKIVGFVGQIYEEKGCFKLIETAPLVIQKLPDVKFLIVGSGDMMDRENDNDSKISENHKIDRLFRRMVDKKKLSDHFIFLGQRFDVEDILPLIDCLTFPSIAPEPFGGIMVEAMACGLPVVASDIGASQEIVVDNITGLLVKPGDPKALSEALIDILTDEEKARRFGEAGRKRAEELFDIEKIAPQLVNMYGI